MKLELFTAMAQRASEKLNELELVKKFGRLNYIARYRGQFDNPNETIPSPAIAIEFNSIEYTDKSKGVQDADFVVKVHVYRATLKNLNLNGVNIEGQESLEYLNEVAAVFHGWAPPCFNSMRRTSEEEDTTYENKLDDVVVFEVKGEDRFTDKRKNHLEVDNDLEVVPVADTPKTAPSGEYPFET